MLVLLGAARIAATYHELSETVDEVAHIGAGMEWLALGRYTFELQHPPVARVAAAAGPYLLGIRAHNQSNLWNEGRQVLYADNAYLRNLTAARLGILAFFFVAAFFLWRLTSAVFGPSVALGAVACFTLLPPILAHFGLATTDGPMLAMCTTALFAMMRWLEMPNVRTGAWLGIASGLAVVTKFSAIPYLGLVGLLLAAAYLWSLRYTPASVGTIHPDTGDGATTRHAWSWRGVSVSMLTAAVAGFVVAWASYRFSMGTVRGIPVPLSEIPKGIAEVVEHGRRGHPAYFLGEVRAHGVWYFFPVLLALKTPIAALVLGAVGFVVTVRRALRTGAWKPLIPVTVAVAILGVAATSNITIGVRHVLPFYVALAMAAAVAWNWIWRRARSPAARAVLAVATVAVSIDTATVHPDYLAYFNAFAGRDPSRLVADSDLDWGQDMFRLRRAVRERGVDTLRFAYIGTADLSPLVGIPIKYWDGYGRPSGWVAVTETWYRVGQISVRRGQYVFEPYALSWLDSAATPTRIGKGIRLYRLPALPAGGAPPRS